jgi:hypothetical protein
VLVAVPAHASIIDIIQVGVSPDRYLTDGQTVTVTASGIIVPSPPNWVVSQCDAAVGQTTVALPDVQANCDLSPTGSKAVQPASDGTIDTQFTVRRTFTTSTGQPVTCGDAFKDCVILVGVISGTNYAGNGASIDFSTPPSITVTPNAHLHSRQTVTVAGTGFTAKPLVNDWSVSQCTAGILDVPIHLSNALKYCDATTQPFVFTHADANGNLSSPFVVRRNFTTSGGIDARCGRTQNACAILVAQITNQNFVGAAAAIDFSPPEATKKSDCLHNGWKHHGRANGSHFARQRSCLSYVKHRA